jgi:putative sterol carrier protein
MANEKEVMEAFQEYTKLSNGNARLRKMNRDWTKVVLFQAKDINQGFLMKVTAGEIVEAKLAPSETTADIIITATSEIFCDMFWGDLNPTQKYLSGELQVKGSQEDIMRLDAISAIIWPE